MAKLVRALALILLSAAAATAEAQSTGAQAASGEAVRDYLQIAERVAPGVHVLRQAVPNFAGVIGNVTVIEQSDGLVLIDSGSSHGVGQRVVQLVRSISDRPVKAVVITHWHNDHPLGLSAILAAWPNADIIAHAAAAADLEAGRTTVPRTVSAEYDAQRVRTLTEAYDAIQANEAARAATAEERAGWARALAARALRLADVPGTHLILPRRTFTDRLTLTDRERPVELIFLGRANTSGDISAWLPRQRVLIAGDAVVAPVPYMFNVYPSDMLAVFDRMRALRYAVLIPGHGVPQRDQSYLDRLSGLVREVQRQVAPLARDNVPLDQVAGRTDFAAQRRSFSGDDPWLAYWFDRYSLTPLIASVHAEARGAPLGPPPVQRR